MKYMKTGTIGRVFADSENTKLTEKYDTFIKKYMSGCDGHSCERLAGLINSYGGEKINGKKDIFCKFKK